MKEFLVITATPDLQSVERICRFFRRRGIPVMIEIRTVRIGGKSAEGYRLRVPADRVHNAQMALRRMFERRRCIPAESKAVSSDSERV